MKALTGRLVVKEISTERKTSSGLIVGDVKQKRYHKCEVISCGGDFDTYKKGKMIKAPCKDGDIIYIKKQTGQPTYLNDVKCWLITFEDVLAVKEC